MSAAFRYDAAMPRFVILRHECPPEAGKPSHWDFMLEREGALLTWSLSELPAALSGRREDFSCANEVAAVRLPDHRLAYLDYEGPISGGRGNVIRAASGDYFIIEENDASLDIELHGDSLAGRVRLERQSADSWTLRYVKELATRSERSNAR